VLFFIRDFHKADFEALWRIDQQCFAQGISYSRPELAAYLRMPGAFTVIAETREDAGPANRSGADDSARGISGILGFVVATLNASGSGHIITIDVIQEARRCGVGSALLSTAEEQLRARGGSHVRLETAVNNASALAFYKRHGYYILKTLPRYYPDGVDAFVMRKDLHSKPPDR
jgi:ribosomal-protein-alanine N-acetyltransferase